MPVSGLLSSIPSGVEVLAAGRFADVLNMVLLVLGLAWKSFPPFVVELSQVLLPLRSLQASKHGDGIACTVVESHATRKGAEKPS